MRARPWRWRLRCIILFQAFFLFQLLPALTLGTSIGVVYRSESAKPDKIVQLLMNKHVRKVRLLNADPLVLKAFANTGIDITVGLQNEELSDISKSIDAAFSWVRRSVVLHIPATNITAVAVGNEVATQAPDLGTQLIQACRNIHAALTFFYLDSLIKVSSPQSIFVLERVLPPSMGRFTKLYLNSVICPLLEFLIESGSFFMVNTYATDIYKSITQDLDFKFVLMQPNMGINDPITGLHYSNMFDASVDAVYAALAALNYSSLRVVVSQTAWSSRLGDKKRMKNAVIYNNNLVRHIQEASGTPLKPDIGVSAYISGFVSYVKARKLSSFVRGQASTHTRFHSWSWDGSLLDDGPQVDSETSASMEEHLRNPRDDVNGERPHTRFHYWNLPASASANTLVKDPYAYGIGAADSLEDTQRSILRTWCVAKPWVTPDALQVALDWTCGPGGADCEPIQLGEPCYLPNTILAHASYAFNSYYQIHLHADGTCDFAGTATVVDEDPSYPGCFYPFRAGQVGAAIGAAHQRGPRARVAFIMTGFLLFLNLFWSNILSWISVAHWKRKKKKIYL